jgi:hypothetical protein
MSLQWTESICNGNLEELKKIPKKNLTEKLCQDLIDKMEQNIHILKFNKNNNIDNEMKYGLGCILDDIQKIEKCILYIKKNK